MCCSRSRQQPSGDRGRHPPVRSPNRPGEEGLARLSLLTTNECETGKIILNDEARTLPELKVALTKIHPTDKGMSVAVRGAQNVDYQYVVSVPDLLQQLEITRVGLATVSAGVSQ